MALPDAGQPEEYTEEEMNQLLDQFKEDKSALTKNQKAAVARYNFKTKKGEEIQFRKPGEAPPAPKEEKPAAKPDAGGAQDKDAWLKDAPAEIQELAKKDPGELSKDEKIQLAKAKSQALRAKKAKKEKSPEDIAREKGMAFDIAKAALKEWKDVVDIGWQTKWPYVIVKDPTKVADVMMWLRDERNFKHFAMMTAVDYPPDRFELVYDLYDYDGHQGVAVKAAIPRETEAGELPAIPSVVPVFRGADWYEREVYDLFGIVFEGHPNLTRIMLPEGWTGHPMRKDYDVTKEQYVAMGADGEDIVSFKEDEGW